MKISGEGAGCPHIPASVVNASPSREEGGSQVPNEGQLSGLKVAPPVVHYSNTPLPSPCRYCHGPSWKTDEEGGAHPCCELWFRRDPTLSPFACPACRASEINNRKYHEAQSRRRGRTQLLAEEVE